MYRKAKSAVRLCPLALGPVGLGYLTAVRQAGGLLRLLLLANPRDFRRKCLLMFLIAGAYGVGLMGFSVATALGFFIVVLAAAGACAMSVDTLYKTLTQSNFPDEQAGQGHGGVGAQQRRRPGGRGWSGLGPGRPRERFC